MSVDYITSRAFRVWGQFARKPGTEWCRHCRKDVVVKEVRGAESQCSLCGGVFYHPEFSNDEAFGAFDSEDGGGGRQAPSDARHVWKFGGGEARAERFLTQQDELKQLFADTPSHRLQDVVRPDDNGQNPYESLQLEEKAESTARKVFKGCSYIRSACKVLCHGVVPRHVADDAEAYWIDVARYLVHHAGVQLYKPLQWVAACLYLAGFQRDPDKGFGFKIGELLEFFDIENARHLKRSVKRVHKILQVTRPQSYRPPSKLVLCGVYMQRIAVEMQIPQRLRVEAYRILHAYCASPAARQHTRTQDRETALQSPSASASSSASPESTGALGPDSVCGPAQPQSFPACMFHIPLRIACACFSLGAAVLRKFTDQQSKASNSRALTITQQELEQHTGLRVGSVSTVCGMIAKSLRSKRSSYRRLDEVTSSVLDFRASIADEVDQLCESERETI